mmetsp:Transcript_8025/g.26426  ORF Transcript_8025/g.26426 Transcript_8025/m.26426 type:complete len:350 (+) Transcript_8025:1768-2817(+)
MYALGNPPPLRPVGWLESLPPGPVARTRLLLPAQDAWVLLVPGEHLLELPGVLRVLGRRLHRATQHVLDPHRRHVVWQARCHPVTRAWRARRAAPYPGGRGGEAGRCLLRHLPQRRRRAHRCCAAGRGRLGAVAARNSSGHVGQRPTLERVDVAQRGRVWQLVGPGALLLLQRPNLPVLRDDGEQVGIRPRPDHLGQPPAFQLLAVHGNDDVALTEVAVCQRVRARDELDDDVALVDVDAQPRARPAHLDHPLQPRHPRALLHLLRGREEVCRQTAVDGVGALRVARRGRLLLLHRSGAPLPPLTRVATGRRVILGRALAVALRLQPHRVHDASRVGVLVDSVELAPQH